MSALAGARLRDRLRRVGPASASARGAAAVLIAALVATAALFAAIGLQSGGFSAWTNSLLALPQGRIVAPANNQNFGWIGRAITQCEAEAARSVDTLYFLVIPVLAVDGDQRAWLAKSNGTVGASVLLLGSQDTLDGLRAGSLRLVRRSFNFAILEPSATRVYQWKPALGVHKFAIRDAKAVATFKPGFEIPAGGDTQWAAGGAITREAGTCYWTGALMRG
ncbi:MAG TPA: hypothetical protein VEN78_37230 [Bradyrhizobium sp.]|nr:hypothetical protein [Bradyrhizobium sp.]